jgi:hypothetical protein
VGHDWQEVVDKTAIVSEEYVADAEARRYLAMGDDGTS